MNETKKKIDELYKQIRELKEQLRKEKYNGIPVEGGSWSVLTDGSVGIPLENKDEIGKVLNQFSSAESAMKHSDMMTVWREELVNRKNERPIDIEVILPFMKRGYVAMDADGSWCWYKSKPCYDTYTGCWESNEGHWKPLSEFNFKQEDSWTTSLKECGL